ncbi:MAG: hypothetical protein IIW72_01500 [Clostridia bacterium]|nr:hypothetical protein [Clostridia bacterium]
MKKVLIIITAVIVVSAVLFAITMGVKKYNEDNALATADSAFEISNENVNITIDENVATQLLTRFSNELLGINKPINEYVMKLSPAKVFEKDACIVELFLTEDSETPEAKYAISGYDCFVFDVAKNEYLLLTVKGAFSVEVTTTSVETTLFYDESNNTILHNLIDGFSKEELGFQKSPSEYIMVATGTSVKADDKKVVYVIRMYEQDGTETNYTCAICNDVVYRYDVNEKIYTKAK